jgi:hypothetical protein
MSGGASSHGPARGSHQAVVTLEESPEEQIIIAYMGQLRDRIDEIQCKQADVKAEFRRLSEFVKQDKTDLIDKRQ